MSRRALQQALQPLYVASCKFFVQPLVSLQQPLAAADAAPASRPAAPRWGAALAAGLLAAAGTSAAEAQTPAADAPPHEDKGWAVLSLDMRRRQFFKYEKRIRELSSPEKVFEYFASRGDTRSGFSMTPGDMMRSVVPVFPPEGSSVVRAGRLPGEPSPQVPQEGSEFFKHFDLRGASGAITFDEWLLFQALLSVPVDDVEVAFMLLDVDADGSVDSSEFGTLVRSLQARAVHHGHSPRHAAAARGDGVGERFGGLMRAFFGADGKRRLSLPVFRTFLADLRAEMVRLEFSYYDYGAQGSISARDFAHSVVGCARTKHVDEYLDKVADMPPALAAARVSAADFVAFRALWRRLRQLAVALQLWRSSAGSITPDDFQRVAARALGTPLPRHVVDVLFYLFPGDDGGLNASFMVSVMDRGYDTGLQAAYDQTPKGPRSFMECVSKCSKQV